jgi:hypothetical protein
LAALVMSARREPLRPARVAGVAVVTMLTMYTQYAALFYVPMLALWALSSPRGVRHGLALAGAIGLGAVPFLLWLPTFLRQPDPYFLKPPWNPGNPLFVPPPNVLDKLGFFAWTIVRSLPLWPEKLAIVLGLFLAFALVGLVMSRRINADAIAMGSFYAVALALIAAAGRLGIRYIAAFVGLLYVFLAWIVTAWSERIALERPSQWARWGAAVTAVLCLFIVTEDIVFSFHMAGMPESGIRTFVRSQPLDPTTLYVIAPDYMTATYAFYARDAKVAYTAFGQTDHPEIFRYGRGASIYSPGAVRNAIIVLGKKASTYAYLDLIVDDASDVAKVSRGRLYRSPARRLLDSMRDRYPLLAQTHYPGRLESVTVYRFRTQGDLRSAQ